MKRCVLQFHSVILCISAFCTSEACFSESPIRARDLGVPFDGTPGQYNAITDVRGVQVGYATLIAGSGKLVQGVGPVRTGVTAILPRGTESNDPVFAGWFTLNGNGEMTGTTWVEDSGFLGGPVMITNTHSVGVVRDAVIVWRLKREEFQKHSDHFYLPVVAETADIELNDINGFHVKPADAFYALDHAHSGPVEEGNVGGGTGMICHGFKGGVGTSSRVLPEKYGAYTIGVLVQCNYGRKSELRIAGIPVGREIPDGAAAEGGPEFRADPTAGRVVPYDVNDKDLRNDDIGSIIIVIATDAPLIPPQLKRLARRSTLGLGRLGSLAGNSSGDIFIAFSTANPKAANPTGVQNLQMLANEELSPLFLATVQATEEAIVNALVAAKTMTGANNFTVEALPHDKLREILRKYNRLN